MEIQDTPKKKNPFANFTPEQRAENLKKAMEVKKANKAAGIVPIHKLTPGRAIRMKCHDCSGYNKAEVRRCELGPKSHDPCPLWQYRCKNPNNLKPTEAEESNNEELDEDDDIPVSSELDNMDIDIE